jgi:hypothetical protein
MEAVVNSTKEANLLLESYLKALRLPAFLKNYRKFAEDAAQANLTHDRFLLALAEQEVAQRECNRTIRRIKAARFPVLKELADFDFSCISSPDKQRVLELAQGSYIRKVEPILMVGNPGLGKPQPIYYLSRFHIFAQPDGHSRRPASPALWADLAAGWHHSEATSGPVLRSLDTASRGTPRTRLGN